MPGGPGSSPLRSLSFDEGYQEIGVNYSGSIGVVFKPAALPKAIFGGLHHFLDSGPAGAIAKSALRSVKAGNMDSLTLDQEGNPLNYSSIKPR